MQIKCRQIILDCTKKKLAVTHQKPNFPESRRLKKVMFFRLIFNMRVSVVLSEAYCFSTFVSV